MALVNLRIYTVNVLGISQFIKISVSQDYEWISRSVTSASFNKDLVKKENTTSPGGSSNTITCVTIMGCEKVNSYIYQNLQQL
jgi:hypothetical protein